MSKTFTDDGDHGRPRGLHPFDVAQGYVPQRFRLTGRTADQVLDLASDVMGGAPAIRWSSAEVEDWQGPPVLHDQDHEDRWTVRIDDDTGRPVFTPPTWTRRRGLPLPPLWSPDEWRPPPDD